MPNFIAKKFILEGKVQGVGCRWQVMELVENIGHLSGFVRNLDSGAVEICLKGPDWRMSDIESLLRTALRPPVKVAHMTVEDMPDSFEGHGFVIKRE